MIDNAAMTKLIFDIFDFESRKLETSELLLRFGEELKLIFGIDRVEAKLLEKGVALSPAEEYAANTMKQTIDNRLSDYSSFKELADLARAGYKSCAILPVVANSRSICVIKLISKQEEKFDKNVANALLISTMVVGSQVSWRSEQEKSINLAKYFDAAFNSMMPQLLMDIGGGIIKANKSMLMLLNANSTEILGKNVRSFFEIDAAAIGALKKGGAAETRLVGKGERRFKVSSGEVNDKMLHVTFYETTQLREMEERAKLLSFSNYESLLMLDPKMNIVWASDNVEKVTRLQKNGIIGRQLLDMVVDRERLVSGIKKMGNGIYTDSARVNIGNGVFQDLKLSLFANQMYGLSCIVVNNSLESSFRSIERNFDELVKLSGDAIVFLDQLGYVQRLNKSAENLFGYREQELVGGPATMLYATKEGQEAFVRSLSIAKQDTTVGNVYAVMKGRKPDAFIPCDTSIKGMTDQDGKPVGYVVVYRELLTKRALEETQDALDEKEKLIDKVEAESDLKTQFIYNISHDLKTPITNIKGFSTLLYNGTLGEVNEEQKGYVKIIIDESDRLMELIKQILDVAKLSSGKIKLELQPIDFRKLGDNPSIKALEEVAAGKGVLFSWNVDYDVGEVNMDPNRIMQVIINLIGNAIKFTDHGSITINIFKKGKSVRVEVKDTGIGIGREDQRKLFRKFYQVHRKDLTMQERSGTGLGLSIVKEIVSLHKGRLGVNSEPGKGSTFWFTIPLDIKKKKPKEQKEQAQPEENKEQQG
ncbi:MAG: PAS domain-containing sensor histidine kinase [Candidatus Micrarchaeota archaeon]|nr:PAS domain-containing sensor histidine kinase [Candidatus Micrarchaeota archaeon]